MKTTSLKKQLRRGFSLVEMLIVIAVIGIIAAIAIPNISDLTGAADEGKKDRNAQQIVSIYQQGKAAGVAWTEDSLANLLTDIDAGKAPTSGGLQGKVFQVPGVKGMDTELATYIVKDSNAGWKYVKGGK